MKRLSPILSLLCATLAFGSVSAQTVAPTAPQSAAAAAPRALKTISYQGMIASDSGTVNGSRDVTFKIYDHEKGGKLLWSEKQSIQVEDGIFRTTLGSVNPLTFVKEGGHYWYTITLDGQEMARTELLNSTPRFAGGNASDSVGGVRYAPSEISYQGMISEGEKPIDGTRELTFSIYDSEEGGKLLWKEAQTLQISKGVFVTKLGKITPLDKLPADGKYWFSLTIDGTEMTRMSLVMPNSTRPTQAMPQTETTPRPATRLK